MKLPRLTIARGMALVAASALLFLAARKWLPSWQRPAPSMIGDFGSYESAPPSDDLSIRVGPNVFAIGSVVRNDRNGALRFEDGRGVALPARSTPEAAGMTRAAPWLDVATIHLAGDPSRLEVLELRVFDHAKRTLLGNSSDDSGAAEIAPGVYQIRRAGAPLPDEVDVWFRANSHPAGAPIHRLPATVGASLPIGKGSLSIAEFHVGHVGYTVLAPPGTSRPTIRWHPAQQVRTHQCSVVLDWAGEAAEVRYQIVAVAHDGRKSFTSIPHFFDFRTERHVFSFDLDPDEIDHFEIRPFGGRHTFYFESVRLPGASRKMFGPLPSVTLKVDGKAVRQPLSEFEPIRILLDVRAGSPITGIDARGFYLSAQPDSSQKPAFQATIEVDGLMPRGWDLIFLGRDGKILKPTASHRGSAGTSSSHRGYWGMNIPLEQLDAIHVVPLVD